jgi:hypothetical protein
MKYIEDHSNKKKFDRYNKGIFILIQRYPECIEVCPRCGNIIYSNIGDKESFKECDSKLEFEMKKIIYFGCGLCGKKIYGNKFLLYRDEVQKLIKAYLEKDKEEQNFYDFFYDVIEPLIARNKNSEEEIYKWKNI